MFDSVFSFGELAGFIIEKFSAFGNFLMTNVWADTPLIYVLLGGTIAVFVGVVLVSWVIPV